MKKLILLTIFLSSCTTVNSGLPNKEQRLNAYEKSAEYGCYVGVQISVDNLNSEQEIQKILDLSLEECPKKANQYRKFIENN